MFEARAEFFVAVAKARWEEKGGGRILPGDNTCRGAVKLRPITFQCVLGLDLNWTSCYIRVRVCQWPYV